MSLLPRIRAGLSERRARHLNRGLHFVPPGAIDLATNDYLGLSVHPEVVEAACAATRDYGTSARASRLVSGHTPIHAALEAELADFKGHEAALVFSSGYQGNLAVISALAGAGDFIFCDKRNHASLIDACHLAQSHGAEVRYFANHSKLKSLLTAATRKLDGGCHFIISDTVFSMDGDLADIAGLATIAMESNAVLILDEAHGTGTLGARGLGALELFSLAGVEYVAVGTLSKALGAQGGYVTGSRDFIDWLTNTARPFIYSTGINPGSCGAALAALRILRREPERLQRLHAIKTQLAQGLRALGYEAREQPAPIIPVIIGEPGPAVALSAALLEHGVWCPAIRTPTVPAGTDRLRVTASCAFSDEQVQQVLAAFAAAKPDAGN